MTDERTMIQQLDITIVSLRNKVKTIDLRLGSHDKTLEDAIELLGEYRDFIAKSMTGPGE